MRDIMNKTVYILMITLVVATTALAQQFNMAVPVPIEVNIPEMDMDFDFDFDINPEIDTNIAREVSENINIDIASAFQGSSWWGKGDYLPHYYGDEKPENTDKEEIHIVIGPDRYNADSEFSIKNINGDVSVVGYDGDEIVIEGTKEIWGRKGKKVSDEDAAKFNIKVEEHEGDLFAYMEAPGVHAEFYEGKMDYHWHDDEDREDINFSFDLRIKVPKNLALNASTVNGGELRIEDMRGDVNAHNVNGSVYVKDVIGLTKANTVNGDIEVWFLESPKWDTRFHTVNGTIEIYSPKDLNAVVTFESIHGELYTDFERVKTLPNRLDKQKSGDGFRYRINKNSPIQIGDGGPEMSFEMVNGSAYIRERKS